MWGKVATVVPALAAMSVFGASPPAALAAGPGDPLFGDLNGDGITDRATLASGAPSGCDIVVRLGDGAGGYGPPSLYSYPTPGTPPYCPDMGVIVDLGGDGSGELVLAWFAGSTADYDLLVLRDFVPDDGFDAIFQPSRIGLEDFNGDGLQDVYEWTDQGEGFESYLNTPSGQLVPGPVRFCFDGVPRALEFADFDEDGATDVMISHGDSSQCPGPSVGVVVVLDDGTVVQLEGADVVEFSWFASVLDADSDGHLDVHTSRSDTAERVTHYGNGDGTFSPK